MTSRPRCTSGDECRWSVCSIAACSRRHDAKRQTCNAEHVASESRSARTTARRRATRADAPNCTLDAQLRADGGTLRRSSRPERRSGLRAQRGRRKDEAPAAFGQAHEVSALLPWNLSVPSSSTLGRTTSIFAAGDNRMPTGRSRDNPGTLTERLYISRSFQPLQARVDISGLPRLVILAADQSGRRESHGPAHLSRRARGTAGAH